jgi:putative endopeptidase
MLKARASLIALGAMLAAAPVLGGAPAVDPSIRPADDFYGYANHAWLQSVTLPEGASSIDTTSMLRTANAQRVRDLVGDAVARAHARPVRPDVRKIGDYYVSRIDPAAIDAKGMSPLSGDLAVVPAIAARKALAAFLGRTLRLDDGSNSQTESLWGVWVHQGFHDPDHYAAHFVQGGLGLSLDDYLASTPDAAAHRALYQAHVASVLRLGGFDRPEIRAARVVDLEIAIARTHASRADTDDVFKTDNDWRSADFPAKAPGMDWAAFFAAAGLAPATRFVVWQRQAVVGGAQLVATQPLDAWKDYLTFHLIDHYAAVLPQTVRDERRAFDAHLAGAPTLPAPDTQPQALAATQAVLGDAIGRLYVGRYFPPSAKLAAQAMVANIRTAFRARIANLTWMSPETKTKALAKLAALRVGLGYPESWVDYAGLAVVRGDAFGNLRRAEAFAYAHEIAKLSRRVNPDEWAGGLYPQAVGAVLNISPNTMQFAAGLLQPPYFDPDGDTAANYGSAGAGIAHEISHSFDEIANLYDAQGRLGLWWSKDDLAHYHAATAPLVTQLDMCCPAPDACAHGKQIVGESSADLAGLLAAHDAYLLSLHGRHDVIKTGLTGEQRFFIAFAQRWRRLQTDAALQRQIASDSHAPPQCRADLVRNVEAWAHAFDLKDGDELYLKPGARFQVW